MDSETDMESFREAALNYSETVVRFIASSYNQREFDLIRQEDLIDRLERALCYMVIVSEVLPNLTSPVIQSLLELTRWMVQERDDTEKEVRRGRPRITIDENQLKFLVESSFRVKDIACIFACSTRTIERRMQELNIRACDYAAMSDMELDEHVSRIVALHPRSGERTILGQLRSRGFRIQRQRIRDSLHRVDPSGVEARSRNVLHRRVYNVPSPNSLWHLDGYHKLIRWNIIIHGAIDGYSRLITYLRVSSNNYASSVLSSFLSAINEFGLPSRIRIDRGGENRAVAEFMLNHPQRGYDRQSVITGSSVHNQRIERLWRDLYSGCASFFYHFFYFLENTGLLDPNDQLDIYSLHLCFLPVIQSQLDVFREGWAHHPLRSENHRTPLQLWILGLNQADPNSTAATSIYAEVDANYGIDWAGPVSLDSENFVIVENPREVLSQAQRDAVMQHIQTPEVPSEEWMVHAFTTVKTFVHSL